MIPLFRERVARHLFVPGRCGCDTPEESCSGGSSRLAQPLLGNGVLFEGRSVGGIDGTLGRQDAGGRTARDPSGADEFGDHLFAVVRANDPPFSLPDRLTSPAAAFAAAERKPRDHLTSATRTMRPERPTSPPKPRATSVAAPSRMLFWRSRMPAERMAATSAEDLAVQQNSGVPTRNFGPSAPPATIKSQLLSKNIHFNYDFVNLSSHHRPKTVIKCYYLSAFYSNNLF